MTYDEKIAKLSEDFSKRMSEAEKRLEAIVQDKFEKIFEIWAMNKVDNTEPEKLNIVFEEKESKPKKLSFNHKRWYFTLAGIAFGVILSIWSFYNLIPLFPFALSIVTSFFGLILLLVKDEIYLPGNSIKKVSSHPIASAIAMLAFVVLIVAGFSMGNSYTSNRYGSETEVSREISEPVGGRHDDIETETTIEDNSTSSGNSVVLPRRSGAPDREQ
jgi:hypothetical protein